MLKKFVLGGMTALVLAACGGEGGSASSSAPAQSAALRFFNRAHQQ